ncbi:MAG: prepilin-type N-terminal cleavage/methylation domain-containing protein [Elusimicrobiota bacterium]|jgi:prepilin-type N-terminal cleavage/methylation domain-containing protein|nr:prepilin-type N-terminal cleavage/methylation domain-containing protein [Elusimicrobiota bacterium]
MNPKNKKGMTLMEMLVVVIVILLMIMAAYPTYMSGLEKARAQEAVQLISHLIAAQDKFQSECYNMTASGCVYSSSFLNLPLNIEGPNQDTNITKTASSITTSAFVYTLSEDGDITATPRNNSYSYTLTATVGDEKIACNVVNGSDSGKKICSAIAKKSNNNTYIIE